MTAQISTILLLALMAATTLIDFRGDIPPPGAEPQMQAAP